MLLQSQFIHQIKSPPSTAAPSPSSEQQIEADMEPQWCLGVDTWWHWSCQGPAHNCHHGLGSGSRWHRESPNKACPEPMVAPSAITDADGGCGWPCPAAPYWALHTCFSTYHRRNRAASTHSYTDFLPGLYLYADSSTNNVNRKFCPQSPFPKACTCCSVLSALLRYVGRTSLHLSPSPHGTPDCFLDQVSGQHLVKGKCFPLTNAFRLP